MLRPAPSCLEEPRSPLEAPSGRYSRNNSVKKKDLTRLFEISRNEPQIMASGRSNSARGLCGKTHRGIALRRHLSLPRRGLAVRA